MEVRPRRCKVGNPSRFTSASRKAKGDALRTSQDLASVGIPRDKPSQCGRSGPSRIAGIDTAFPFGSFPAPKSQRRRPSHEKIQASDQWKRQSPESRPPVVAQGRQIRRHHGANAGQSEPSDWERRREKADHRKPKGQQKNERRR
jgi:hypothetical protein